jgi:ABC-type transporter Mla MlaB component
MQNTYSLPAELSIYTVGELRTKWLEWLSPAPGTDGSQNLLDDAFSVDAASVGEVDGAGVQLLLSLAKALARRERTLSLVSPSQPLVDACAALGASALLANADETETHSEQ